MTAGGDLDMKNRQRLDRSIFLSTQSHKMIDNNMLKW